MLGSEFVLIRRKGDHALSRAGGINEKGLDRKYKNIRKCAIWEVCFLPEASLGNEYDSAACILGAQAGLCDDASWHTTLSRFGVGPNVCSSEMKKRKDCT